MKNCPATTPIGTSDIVISRDGTKIGYPSVGAGPSVLVIPGVLSMAAVLSAQTGQRHRASAALA